jgi:exodeoxyribonuclease-3
VKIATYNVNGIKGRLPVLLRWLAECQPDIACLQEVKTSDDTFPIEALRNAGYEAIWHGQKSYNGVAILSRSEPPVEIRRGLPGDPDDTHSRYLEATVGDLTVGCLYLPNGNPAPGERFDYKLRWFERLVEHGAGLMQSKKPIVLCGDYNAVPTELDCDRPERWIKDAVFMPETRAAYARLLEQGWLDSVRHMHPGEKLFTYWDYFRLAFQRNVGIRMDHLLLSPSVARTLTAAEVDRHVRGWEKTSDHAPVWITV